MRDFYTPRTHYTDRGSIYPRDELDPRSRLIAILLDFGEREEQGRVGGRRIERAIVRTESSRKGGRARTENVSLCVHTRVYVCVCIDESPFREGFLCAVSAVRDVWTASKRISSEFPFPYPNRISANGTPEKRGGGGEGERGNREVVRLPRPVSQNSYRISPADSRKLSDGIISGPSLIPLQPRFRVHYPPAFEFLCLINMTRTGGGGKRVGRKRGRFYRAPARILSRRLISR